ncbi:MAG: Gfo/Idh/MocA family oxidoreductase [Eubacterium sp.]|nr:Gfo/Idh/MocA family oxidoreductase [Eubacterium sp.]
MSTLRIGVIGCGMIGREHIKRLNQRLQGCKVTAVCDVFEEGARRGAEIAGEGTKVYTVISEIVNDPEIDALVVTTPEVAHFDAVIEAIKAGKPVFVEKPLAATADDCMRIVEAEVASGKHLVQVGFMRRYDRGYRQVKALLDSGEFGEALIVKGTHRNQTVDESYETPLAVFGTVIHEIDCLHWLVNDDFVSAQVLFGKDTKYTHSKLRDPQVMIMKTRKGVNVIVEVFVNCQFGYDINTEVVCEEGVIHMPAPSVPTVRKDGNLSAPIEQSWIGRFLEAYDAELQEWVNCAKEGIVTGPNAWDGYLAAVTADALVKAQETGAIESIETEEKPAFYD